MIGGLGYCTMRIFIIYPLRHICAVKSMSNELGSHRVF